MKTIVWIVLVAMVLFGGMMLSGCESTQSQNSDKYNGADRRADPGNSSLGNGAYGENP